MDTPLTIERIKHALDQRFGELIDLSDLPPNTPGDVRRRKQLSRSIAALVIMALSDAEADVAANSVTDGHDDLGLDAIYFDSTEDTLYVVQSKFSDSGSKTIELGDCQKFLAGLRDLIHADFSKANERLRRREHEIHNILMRSDVRIVMVAAHTGANTLGDQVRDALDKFLREQNNAGQADVFSLEVFDLARVYTHLDPAARKKINLTFGLSAWGIVSAPYHAYYGQLKVSDVASWAYIGRPLLDRNLRFYRGSTEVNNAMDDTIVSEPEKFWYFNNGITVLCDRIAKAPLNGTDNSWGVFDCEGVSVVNGAQTVGVIWERTRQSEGLFKTSSACLHMRIISLENCPEGFAADVTRATNTQNEIKHRDFAALDDIQHQIAREMALDNRRYAFKSGDPDPQGKDGCTIEEATVALACASPDVSLAVAAKREIGSLWRDLNKPPYTTIFNASTKARDLWRAVIVCRAVEMTLRDSELAAHDRGDQLLVHGNRFILHTVFQESDMQIYKDATITEDVVDARAKQVTKRVFMAVAKAVNEKHPSAYLQPLFKNAQKCRELLSSSHGTAKQPDFFEESITNG